jgi:hypothetical protein
MFQAKGSVSPMYRLHFSSSSRLSGVRLFALALGLSACGGQKRAHAPHGGDTTVPQATQRESEKQMGEQQMMMQDLNMTPSERAASQHERKMDRRNDRRNEEE